MPPKRTIFEHDSEPKHTWVQTRVILSKDNVKHISLRLTDIPDEGGQYRGRYEITDFRCPNHPEIDWNWLDRHASKVWAAIEFSG